MSYHGNDFKLSRAMDYFLFLRFCGALTLKSAVSAFYRSLKVILSKCHHYRIVPNTFFLTGP